MKILVDRDPICKVVGVAVDPATLKRRKTIIKQLRKLFPEFRIQPLERKKLLDFYDDLEDIIKMKKAAPESRP